MKVKVGNKIYDGDKEPVMVILTPKDRENISQMSAFNQHYCQYPDLKKWTENNHIRIKEWMNT